MKAQAFFGGTNPKQTGKKVRQVGHTGSAHKGGVDFARKNSVTQVGTHNSGGPNHKMHRDSHYTTKSTVGRPAGKERNNQGN